MVRFTPELADNPDRLRWNARYSARPAPDFKPHPLAIEALAQALPSGPVLELAAGPSGSAILAAQAGRPVTVADASDVALDLLEAEADRRGLRKLLTLVQADLEVWQPGPASYALVLCTAYWVAETGLFDAAAQAVLPGGILAWEALTATARRERPSLPAAWCLKAGEPASLLPVGWRVIAQYEPPKAAGTRRRLIAARPGTY